ncbi:hypothetical protein BDW62DRAFT_111787 [Aspergillus aurantiobrunneus]
MDGSLDNLTFHHFALLYIDQGGKLSFEASPSIANDCQSILSPEVTHSFLKAVAGSQDGTKIVNPSESNIRVHGGGSPFSPDSPMTPTLSRGSSISLLADNQQEQRRASHEYVIPKSIACYPKTTLSIGNQSLLRRYYEKAFDILQQTNCRILAKAYIKLVEPRKQVNYPYNGRKIVAGVPQQFDPEETKPVWWPAGVNHREPDHLRKPARIRLLIRILCELRESHSICVEKLKEADQSIRRQISPVDRLQVLDEIYQVREEEERYLNGLSDGQAVVSVSRVHLPDMADSQRPVYPPTGSIVEPDSTSREEIPGLEPLASVFPSSTANISFTQREVDTTSNPVRSGRIPQPVLPAAPTTWDACHSSISVPTSLPSINPAIKHTDTDMTSYGLGFSASSVFPSHEPSATLDMQPFGMNSYASLPQHLPSRPPHQTSGHPNHPQSHTSAPIMRTSGASLDGCAHPYYLDY